MKAHCEDTGVRSLSPRDRKALKWKMHLWRYYRQEYLWKWIEGMCFTLREAREHFSITACGRRDELTEERESERVQEERCVWCVNSSVSPCDVHLWRLRDSFTIKPHTIKLIYLSVCLSIISRLLALVCRSCLIKVTHSSEAVIRSAVTHTCTLQQSKSQIQWRKCVNCYQTPHPDCDCVCDMKY